MAGRLTEITCILIRNCIQTNIGQALASIAANRAASIDQPDPAVTLENPKQYFFYPRAAGYSTPAIFVIDAGMDLRQPEMQGNFVTGLARINVSLVVEEKDRERLTYKTWRYQAALHTVLEQAVLISSDSAVKLSVNVRRLVPSAIYTDAADENDPDATFRKEIYAECEVQHWEALGESGTVSCCYIRTTGSVDDPVLIGSGGVIATFPGEPQQEIRIAGNGLAVTATIQAGTVDGQILTLVGSSDANTVTIDNGSGAIQNGPAVLDRYGSITYKWQAATSVWKEDGRSDL